MSPPKSSCSATSFSSSQNESLPGTSQSSSNTTLQTANGSASMISGKTKLFIILSDTKSEILKYFNILIIIITQYIFQKSNLPKCKYRLSTQTPYCYCDWLAGWVLLKTCLFLTVKRIN